MVFVRSLPALPTLEAPPGDPSVLWRAQRGWRADSLTPADWRLGIPSALAHDILARAARASSVEEAAAGWRPDSAASALQERVEALLEGGVGFCLMRGLPLSGEADVDERAALLFGLLFGRPVSQTKKGNLVARVEDLGHDLSKPTVRGHQTAAELAFHCDRADRVVLFCVRTARTGGRSRIVSARALADTLAVEAPHLAARLRKPLPQDRRGEEAPGERPFSTIPVFSERDGVFVARYLRRFIHDSQRHPDAPRLTEEDVAALDALDALIERDGMAIEMPLAPGDVQILNNNVVFHARTAFEDHVEPGRRRLLLRLWLAHSSARPLPDSFADLYGATEPGADRGGVWPDGGPPTHGARGAPAVLLTP
ncbi:MAG: TauD/TfdA family dioxygenase [Microvirga sp.]|nr:TauD/TfdA family dioxygenase [Microvirga sp.]